MGRVSGKVALISGGARGMGATHARRLISEGAKVMIVDILDDEGAQLVSELGEAARYEHVDVTQLADWERAVAATIDQFGRLDILVNNAGIATFGPIDEITPEAWDRTIAINLTGVFNGVKAAVEAMKATAAQYGSASIINVSSTAGLQGYQSLCAYNASKYGVRGFTKSIALDLAQYGIRANSVHPGAIETPMTAGLSNSQEHVAMKRMGKPEELANLVLFLASDESSFSTGAEFIADGGETAGLAQPVG